MEKIIFIRIFLSERKVYILVHTQSIMSRGLHASEMRKNKIKAIEEVIRDSKEGQDKKILIARCTIEFGNTREKVKEYIQTMIEAEMIYEKDGKLWA